MRAQGLHCVSGGTLGQSLCGSRCLLCESAVAGAGTGVGGCGYVVQSSGRAAADSLVANLSRDKNEQLVSESVDHIALTPPWSGRGFTGFHTPHKLVGSRAGRPSTKASGHPHASVIQRCIYFYSYEITPLENFDTKRIFCFNLCELAVLSKSKNLFHELRIFPRNKSRTLQVQQILVFPSHVFSFTVRTSKQPLHCLACMSHYIKHSSSWLVILETLPQYQKSLASVQTATVMSSPAAKASTEFGSNVPPQSMGIPSFTVTITKEYSVQVEYPWHGSE